MYAKIGGQFYGRKYYGMQNVVKPVAHWPLASVQLVS